MSMTSHRSHFQSKNIVKHVCSTQKYKDLWDLGLYLLRLSRLMFTRRPCGEGGCRVGGQLGVRNSYEEERVDSRLQLSSQWVPFSC